MAEWFDKFYYGMYPRKKAMAEEAEYTRTLREHMAAEDAYKAKERDRIDKEREDHKQAVEGARLVEIGGMTGNYDLVTAGLNKVNAVMPNGIKKVEIYRDNSGKYLRQYDAGGNKTDTPLDGKTLQNIYAETMSLVNPEKWLEERGSLRRGISDFNATSEKIRTEGGGFAQQQRDEDGNVYWKTWDKNGNEGIAKNPPLSKRESQQDTIFGLNVEDKKASIGNKRLEAEIHKEDLKQRKEEQKSNVGVAQPGAIFYEKKTGKIINTIPKSEDVKVSDIKVIQNMIQDAGEEPSDAQVSLINQAADKLGYEYVQVDPGKDNMIWPDKPPKYALISASPDYLL